MIVTINGKKVDITLENEKTMGDFLGSMEIWLEKSGYSLSGIRVDDRDFGADELPSLFDRDISTVDRVDIRASNWSALLRQALEETRVQLQEYTAAPFQRRQSIVERFKEGAAARLLEDRDRRLYQRLLSFFSGDGDRNDSPLASVEEQLREIDESEGELALLTGSLEALAQRLEDFPLDTQTGKDKRAHETIELFSSTLEKLLRLIPLLRLRGVDLELLTLGDSQFKAFMEELDLALRELLAAYEAKDTVLVGDLTEYELAPRLRTLYTALSGKGPTPVKEEPCSQVQ
jgi:hypothetical protein